MCDCRLYGSLATAITTGLGTVFRGFFYLRMNTVKLWGEKHQLFKDIQHGSVQHCFTRGQCHSLARAIHRLTGWQLAVLCHNYVRNNDVNQYGDHVVCIHPNGKYVDIYGAWEPGTRFEFLPKTILVSEKEVMKLRNWDRQNLRMAMPFAKEVVKALSQ